MQKSTNDKNQHMVNEKFILREVLMKKEIAFFVVGISDGG